MGRRLNVDDDGGRIEVSVRYSLFSALTFGQVSAYLPVGELRALVAQQLNMELHTVALIKDGQVLQLEEATVEEALGSSGRSKKTVQLVSRGRAAIAPARGRRLK